MGEMDDVDEKNMNNLEKVGNELLHQNVMRMNVNTFVPFELNQTNAQALDRCVHSLSHSRIFYYVCLKLEAESFRRLFY